MMRGKCRSSALLLAALPLLAACGSNSSNDATSNSTAATAAPVTYAQACEAAKRGGPVDWWTQDPETSNTTIKWFNEEYPDIEVKTTQVKEPDIAQRIVAEKNGGRDVSADLVVSNPAALQPLVQRDLIDTSHRLPSEVPQNLISPSYGVRISRRAGGLVYNTDRVKPADLPDTWEALADPRYDGQVSVHTSGIPFDILSTGWGLDKGLDYANKLKETVHPAAIDGTTAGIQAAASGEVPIAASGRESEMKEQRAAGAPVDIKYLDYVPVVDYYEAIPAGARDVNGAICFATWYVSPDIARRLEELSFVSNADKPADLPAGSELVVPDGREAADTSAEAAQQISQIWANG
jgi:iron(III) transport system substrate-binding protein